MRKIVVGDVCGELDLLKQLMEAVSPTADDYFLFLGSYLGPGKDSKGVLDYLIDFKGKYQCNFLRGCYETIFQQIIGTSESGIRDRGLEDLWKSMGGDKVLRSYAVPDDFKVIMSGGKIVRFGMPFAIPEPHIQFLEKELHLWYMDHGDPGFAAYHAGPDRKQFTNPRPENILMGENGWWESDFRLPNINIVFGHIPFKKPFKAPGKRGLCLGAGQGGDKMCAWIADIDEFVVVGGAHGN